jgi:glycosyltransferase involved in cell wall biosynthesis
MHFNQIWFALFSDVESDPRPNRAMELFRTNGYKCKTLASKDNLHDRPFRFSEKFRYILTILKFQLNVDRDKSCEDFMRMRYGVYEDVSHKVSEGDLIFIFDLDFLALLINSPKRCKYLIDLREIYTEQYGSSLQFRFILRPMRKHLIDRHFHLIDKVITVSRGLQDFYLNEFQVESEIIKSAPKFRIDKAQNKATYPIKIVYLGIAHPLRRLEDIISACNLSISQLEIHFYLVGDTSYIDYLKSLPNIKGRIHFHNPVIFSEIHSTLINFDIGWSFFSPQTENLARALPNKFFDYVQAGLGVICSPSIDMLQESEPWGFGLFPRDFSQDSLVNLLDGLTLEKVSQIKSASREASKFINYEKEGRYLINLIQSSWRSDVI